MSGIIENKIFREWINSCGDDGYRYLPDEFKDFHDQKDLFKEIYNTYENAGNYHGNQTSWVEMHCFCIDIFLWHMARKGYTLQKCRSKFIKKQLEES